MSQKAPRRNQEAAGCNFVAASAKSSSVKIRTCKNKAAGATNDLLGFPATRSYATHRRRFLCQPSEKKLENSAVCAATVNFYFALRKNRKKKSVNLKKVSRRILSNLEFILFCSVILFIIAIDARIIIVNIINYHYYQLYGFTINRI